MKWQLSVMCTNFTWWAVDSWWQGNNGAVHSEDAFASLEEAREFINSNLKEIGDYQYRLIRKTEIELGLRERG